MSRDYARAITLVTSSGEPASTRPARSGTKSGRPRMRLLTGGKKPVVELTSSVPQNRLYETYRALRARGVQVIHTAVRRSGDTIIQLLHLAEVDGSELTPRRLRETIATLMKECGIMLMRSPRDAVNWMEPQLAAAAGGAAWQPSAT